MGIFGAMTTAVGGLQAQSFALENISGNIANSQTTGFKRVDTSFADMVASSSAKRQTAGGVTALSRQTNNVQGDIKVNHKDAASYAYMFVGNDTNDRFQLSLDGGRLSYMCVANDEGTLSVRNIHDNLSLVTELPLQGTLDELLMGAHSALIKNKSARWRVELVGEALGLRAHVGVQAEDFVDDDDGGPPPFLPWRSEHGLHPPRRHGDLGAFHGCDSTG